ncbi:MAG: 2,5-dioxopentanoate dehydrogenase, partial [Paraburkholderia sp.]|nr:2,5-dioxopentanoate dehydrogenase [Paraburkholderia sp.]
MSITGEMLIGRKAVRGEEKPLRAFNPATGSEIAEP